MDLTRRQLQRLFGSLHMSAEAEPSNSGGGSGGGQPGGGDPPLPSGGGGPAADPAPKPADPEPGAAQLAQQALASARSAAIRAHFGGQLRNNAYLRMMPAVTLDETGSLTAESRKALDDHRQAFPEQFAEDAKKGGADPKATADPPAEPGEDPGRQAAVTATQAMAAAKNAFIQAYFGGRLKSGAYLKLMPKVELNADHTGLSEASIKALDDHAQAFPEQFNARPGNTPLSARGQGQPESYSDADLAKFREAQIKPGKLGAKAESQKEYGWMMGYGSDKMLTPDDVRGAAAGA